MNEWVPCVVYGIILGQNNTETLEKNPKEFLKKLLEVHLGSFFQYSWNIFLNKILQFIEFVETPGKHTMKKIGEKLVEMKQNPSEQRAETRSSWGNVQKNLPRKSFVKIFGKKNLFWEFSKALLKKIMKNC